jgi:hypothetical protein
MMALAREKAQVEIDILRVDLETKIRKLETPEPPEEEPNHPEADAAMAIAEAVDGLAEGVSEFKSVVEHMTISQQENAKGAIEAVKSPKRVIREKGRIVGIE